MAIRANNVGTLGTVTVTGTVAGGAQYTVGATSMGATATGTVLMGIVGTTARAILINTTGGIGYLDTVGNISTGTVSVIPTGTQGVDVKASINLPVYKVNSPQKIQGFVIATTSAAGGVIVVTSGGHTIHITDVLVSALGPMNVQLCSETTAFGIVYLATQGGFAWNLGNAMACTSAQSFRVILSSSGACGVSMVGFTVT